MNGRGAGRHGRSEPPASGCPGAADVVATRGGSRTLPGGLACAAIVAALFASGTAAQTPVPGVAPAEVRRSHVASDPAGAGRATVGEVGDTANAPTPRSRAQRHPPAQRGLASWYGGRLHGRRTASGERFDMHAMTAAHRTLPMSSSVRVHNPANGRSVTVRINDRGPFHRGRMIDLSRAAALALDVLGGPAMVEMRHLIPVHAHTARDAGETSSDRTPPATTGSGGERDEAAAPVSVCTGPADAARGDLPADFPPPPPAAGGDETAGR